ncbi:MAG TPA: di-heme oxidoredictase family protein [Azospirillum sp.]|nr:di-heme oxidoredictase family protein [Azospirillum sp.]
MLSGTVAAADADELDFGIGQAVFERLWVAAPTATQAADGLGPLYNARSCAACHPQNGRGHPPAGRDPQDLGVGFALRLNDDPVYGRQIQALGTPGQVPEGRPTVTWRDEKVPFPDGSVTVLRRPVWGVADLGYGALAGSAALSPRVAPAVRGLGLLERVPEADILAWEDPDDRDGDGISSRANRGAGGALGRFGWKAVNPTVSHQNAEAFSLDIGMSTPLFTAAWGDCTAAQDACRTAPHGDSPQFEGLEIPSTMLALVDGYLRDLPPGGGLEAPKAKGADLFEAAGCAACHRPSFTTGEDAAAPHLSKRTVFPYTDLLVHDLGDALADGVAAGLASGREWRTAPLWGMNRLAGEDGRLALLHDGRARSVAEAILWHGGEAEAARRRFMALPRAERQRLIRFVLSL